MKHRYLKNVATLNLDTEKCTGCTMCTQVCPHNVLSIANGKAVITDRNSCIECGGCMKNCPANAISVDAGTGCAYAVIRSIFTKDKPSCTPNKDKKSCC